MNIALIGYGQMGKRVQEAALSRGHKIVAIIDPEQTPYNSLTPQSIEKADVCIDFTSPDSILNNIKLVASQKKDMVIGTTGWYQHLPEVEQIIKQSNTGLIYSPNFSLGVSLFLKIIEEAAKLIDPFDEYDVGGIEIHHNKKQDSPSGTAKAIAHVLLKNMHRKQKVVYDKMDRMPEKEEIHFTSLRTGYEPGNHSVIFDSPIDTITLTHTARNREGFAKGAVLAAEWVLGKKGVFTMDQMIQETQP